MTNFDITLTGSLAKKLLIAAQQKNLSIEDMLIIWLEESQQRDLETSNWALEMGRMAEADTDIVWDETAADLSESENFVL